MEKKLVSVLIIGILVITVSNIMLSVGIVSLLFAINSGPTANTGAYMSPAYPDTRTMAISPQNENAVQVGIDKKINSTNASEQTNITTNITITPEPSAFPEAGNAPPAGGQFPGGSGQAPPDMGQRPQGSPGQMPATNANQATPMPTSQFSSGTGTLPSGTNTMNTSDSSVTESQLSAIEQMLANITPQSATDTGTLPITIGNYSDLISEMLSVTATPAANTASSLTNNSKNSTKK